jgi:isopenicillin N synthase-like dioxygenase
LSSDPDVRKELAAKVRDACSNVGFFYAQNHPVPEEVISKTFKAIADFFALPKEEKMEVHIQKNPAIRGYEPPFETKLDIKTKGDFKEAFSIGDDPLDPEQKFPGTPPTNFVPQNLWPSSAPWLREALYEYYSHIFPFAKRLTAIFALALELSEDYFDHMFTFPITGLRVRRIYNSFSFGLVNCDSHYTIHPKTPEVKWALVRIATSVGSHWFFKIQSKH